MGHEVRRPPISGQGEKPTTPRPTPDETVSMHSRMGERPTSPKPTPVPTQSQAAAPAAGSPATGKP